MMPLSSTNTYVATHGGRPPLDNAPSMFMETAVGEEALLYIPLFEEMYVDL